MGRLQRASGRLLLGENAEGDGDVSTKRKSADALGLRNDLGTSWDMQNIHAQDDGMQKEAVQAWEEAVAQKQRERRRFEEREETVLGVPKIALDVRFKNRQYLPGRHPRENLSSDWYSAIEAPDDYDFTPLLLAHAKLYTLADRYMIQSLKDLSLHKLHRDLQCLSIVLITEGVADQFLNNFLHLLHKASHVYFFIRYRSYSLEFWDRILWIDFQEACGRDTL